MIKFELVTRKKSAENKVSQGREKVQFARPGLIKSVRWVEKLIPKVDCYGNWKLWLKYADFGYKVSSF